MASGDHEMTPTGHLKRASLQQVCWWTWSAWHSVSFDSIVKSFKMTGISNNMDSTEDEHPWAGVNDKGTGDTRASDTSDTSEDDKDSY